MMPPVKTRVSLLLTALLVGSSALLPARTAHASSTYPPEVQKTIAAITGSFCVPQCVLCHRTNEGGIGTLNVFGTNLKAKSNLGPLVPASVGPKLTDYIMNHADIDSDGDQVTDVVELEAGDSPAIAGDAGKNLICPDIKYGCGARIAPAPPAADRAGLFAAGAVLFGFAALLRRRTRTRPRTPG